VRNLSNIVDGLDQAFFLCLEEKEKLIAAQPSRKRKKKAQNKKLRSIPQDLEPSRDLKTTPTTVDVIRGAFYQAFSSSADDSGLRFTTDDPRFQRISAAKIVRGVLDNEDHVNILMLAMLIHLSIKDSADLSRIEEPTEDDTLLGQVQIEVASMVSSLKAAIKCKTVNEEIPSLQEDTARLLRVLEQFVNLKEPFTVYANSLSANAGTIVYVHERYLTTVNRLFDTWSFGYMAHLYHALRDTDRIEENRVFAGLLKAYWKPLMLDKVNERLSFELAALDFRGRSRVPPSVMLILPTCLIQG
jgi:hypothetical protein